MYGVPARAAVRLSKEYLEAISKKGLRQVIREHMLLEGMFMANHVSHPQFGSSQEPGLGRTQGSVLRRGQVIHAVSGSEELVVVSPFWPLHIPEFRVSGFGVFLKWGFGV